MLEEYFVQTCELVTTNRNEYGDYLNTSLTTLPCRFREISTVKRSSHSEDNDSDAMLWVSAGAAVVKGSLIKFDGVIYQVEKITKARRLGESTVQFLKCDLKVVGIS